MAEDKQWASEYILDPLSAPGPSEETGLNTHFGTIGNSPPTSSSSDRKNSAKVESQPTGSTSNTTETNPFRRGTPKSSSSTHARNVSAPVPSKGPAANIRSIPHNRSSKPPSYREALAGSENDGSSPSATGRPRRASSLSSRFPGDRSHHPLAMLREDARAAHRSPHLQRRHIPGADSIDSLATLSLSPNGKGLTYHHEGPYDAALLARNTSWESSPLAAVRRSNAEALRATPVESIRDAVERHRPLDNTASVPPGVPDRMGRVLRYEEGSNLMTEPAADDPGYKRWPGVEYARDDIKGHGKPGWDAAAWGSRGSAAPPSRSARPSRHPIDLQNEHYHDHDRAASDKYLADGQRESDVELCEQAPVPRRTSGDFTSGFMRRIGSLRRRRDEAVA